MGIGDWIGFEYTKYTKYSGCFSLPGEVGWGACRGSCNLCPVALVHRSEVNWSLTWFRVDNDDDLMVGGVLKNWLFLKVDVEGVNG